MLSERRTMSLEEHKYYQRNSGAVFGGLALNRPTCPLAHARGGLRWAPGPARPPPRPQPLVASAPSGPAELEGDLSSRKIVAATTILQLPGLSRVLAGVL